MANEEIGISRYMQSALERADIRPNSKVLDAPTGYGRHAHWLSKHGYEVVAVDCDDERIKTAQRTAPEAWKEIVWRVANLEEPSSLMDGSFDAVICIHYFSENILRRALEALTPGGILILETFGGQGQNWRDLPRKGWMAEALRDKFAIISVEERPVGPRRENVTLKVLARKL